MSTTNEHNLLETELERLSFIAALVESGKSEDEALAVVQVVNHPSFEKLDEAGREKLLKAADLTSGDWLWIAEGLEHRWLQEDAVDGIVRHEAIVRMWVQDALKFSWKDLDPRLHFNDDIYMECVTATELRDCITRYTNLLEACELYGITDWQEADDE